MDKYFLLLNKSKGNNYINNLYKNQTVLYDYITEIMKHFVSIFYGLSILNDNNMSISHPVGCMASYMT